jgi:hypothetical protein
MEERHLSQTLKVGFQRVKCCKIDIGSQTGGELAQSAIDESDSGYIGNEIATDGWDFFTDFQFFHK